MLAVFRVPLPAGAGSHLRCPTIVTSVAQIDGPNYPRSNPDRSASVLRLFRLGPVCYWRYGRTGAAQRHYHLHVRGVDAQCCEHPADGLLGLPSRPQRADFRVLHHGRGRRRSIGRLGHHRHDLPQFPDYRRQLVEPLEMVA